MRISFDLDDTLFVSEEKFKVEAPLRFPFCAIYKERLSGNNSAYESASGTGHGVVGVYHFFSF